jgi:hypothetical protein
MVAVTSAADILVALAWLATSAAITVAATFMEGIVDTGEAADGMATARASTSAIHTMTTITMIMTAIGGMGAATAIIKR